MEILAKKELVRRVRVIDFKFIRLLISFFKWFLFVTHRIRFWLGKKRWIAQSAPALARHLRLRRKTGISKNLKSFHNLIRISCIQFYSIWRFIRRWAARTDCHEWRTTKSTAVATTRTHCRPYSRDVARAAVDVIATLDATDRARKIVRNLSVRSRPDSNASRSISLWPCSTTAKASTYRSTRKFSRPKMR